MTTRTVDMLWEAIEEAERDFVKLGFEQMVSLQPQKFQMVLTGRFIREVMALRQDLKEWNGNGRNGSRRNRFRQVAINISVPAITGAGGYAAVLELIRMLGGGQ